MIRHNKNDSIAPVYDRSGCARHNASARTTSRGDLTGASPPLAPWRTASMTMKKFRTTAFLRRNGIARLPKRVLLRKICADGVATELKNADVPWRLQYRRLANQRKDRAHKVSAKLVATHALIVTEKLKIANLTRSSKASVQSPGKNVAQKAGLNREILDTTPGTLINMLRVKAEEAACEIMFVDPKVHKPSQTCPACGARKKKALSERQHACPCGFRAGRDQAAALVLLKIGLAAKGQVLAPGATPKLHPERRSRLDGVVHPFYRIARKACAFRRGMDSATARQRRTFGLVICRTPIIQWSS